MQIVKVLGGLGNQMFWYAYGQALGKVRYNIEWYKHPDKQDYPRTFYLDRYNTDITYTIKEPPGKWISLWKTTKKALPLKNRMQKHLKVKSKYLTPEYFKYKKLVRSAPSVAMHFRRGDKVGYSRYILLDKDYYDNAYKIIRESIGDFNLFVFSDGLDWCRENLDYPNMHFVGLQEYLDLEIMSMCDHAIIANSTFSWWGAFLNNNPDQIVVCPKLYYSRSRKDYKTKRQHMTYSTQENFGFIDSWIKI